MSGLPRTVEASLALAGLALCAPVMAAAAIAIRATSPGPAIFVQERVGKGGRTFKMFKFRSMSTGGSGPQVTARGDRRITPVGKLLRKSKVDELPELWNVVRGDMSLVGPRPEVPTYVDQSDRLWQRVLEARPGLTDPVTLRLRNEEELLATAPMESSRYYREKLLPFKLSGYIDYLEKRTWRSDVEVLFRTAAAVVLPSRAPLPTLEEVEAISLRARALA